MQDLARLLLPHLQGALSESKDLRWSSFLLLEKAEKENLDQYLIALISILTSPQCDEVVRLTAGVRIKNGTSGKGAVDNEKKKAYLNLPEGIRKELRGMVLEFIPECPPFLSKTLSQVIASIGTSELQGGKWDELIPRLCQFAQHDTTYIALQYLLEDIFLCQCYIEENNQQEQLNLCDGDLDKIMEVVLKACADEGELERRKSGLRTLYHTITFLDEYLNPARQSIIFNVLKSNLSSGDPAVSVLAWESVHQICLYLYDNVEWDDIMQTLAPLTMSTLQLEVSRSDDRGDLCLAVLSFWSSLADTELEKKQEGRGSKNIMERAKDHLIPCLLTLLRKEDEDEDEWNAAMAAMVCLGYCAGLFGDSISHFVLAYVEQNFRSPDWSLRESAILAFGTIMEGSSEAHMVPILQSSLNNFIPLIMDAPYGNIAVQDTASWTLGQVAKYYPATLEPFVEELVPALIQLLGHAPRVARYICFIIYELAAYAREEKSCLLTQYNELLLQNLMITAKREDSNALSMLSAEAFETISMLIMQFSPSDAHLVDLLIKDLGELLAALPGQGQNQNGSELVKMDNDDLTRIRSYIIGCIQTCINYYTSVDPPRPGSNINFQAILDLLVRHTERVIKDINTPPAADEEVNDTERESKIEELTILSMTVETVLQLGSQTKSVLLNESQTQVLLSVIDTGLKRDNTETQWDASMALLTALIQIPNGDKIDLTFINRMVQQMCHWMRESSTNLMLKLLIISALGDIAVYLNFPITEDNNSILKTLLFASKTTVEDLRQVFLEEQQTIMYVRSLRENSLVSLGQVANSVKISQNESQRSVLQNNTNLIINFITMAMEDYQTANERIYEESLELLSDLLGQFGEALAEHLRTFESANKMKMLFANAKNNLSVSTLSSRAQQVLCLYDNV